MKASVRGVFFVLAAASALVACASKDAARPAGTASASASAPQAAGAASATSTKALNGDYRRVERNGQEYFCRREAAEGSRTRFVETCLTQAQIKEQSEHSQSFLRKAQGAAGEAPIEPPMDNATPK